MSSEVTDLAPVQLAATDEFPLGAERDQVGMRGGKAVEALGEQMIDC